MQEVFRVGGVRRAQIGSEEQRAARSSADDTTCCRRAVSLSATRPPRVPSLSDAVVAISSPAAGRRSSVPGQAYSRSLRLAAEYPHSMAMPRISTCARVWTSQYRGGFSRSSASMFSAVSENRRLKFRRCASLCASQMSLSRTFCSQDATCASSSWRKTPSPRSSVATVQSGYRSRVSGTSRLGTSPTRSNASILVNPSARSLCAAAPPPAPE